LFLTLPTILSTGQIFNASSWHGLSNATLGGLPGHMRIEAEPGIGVSAKTVGELRKVNWIADVQFDPTS
jgi:hypothetical protein